MTQAQAQVFEDGLVDRLQQQWPDIDVHLVATNALDMIRRKRVRNPNALLVHMVREAAAKRASAANVQQARSSSQQLRYAAFHAELLRKVAEQGLRPVDVAGALRNAMVSGFPALNPVLIDILEAMGPEWKRVA